MSDIVFHGVSKSFSGAVVLSKFTATVSLRGLTFVIGKSGSGKSVLCRLAVGLLNPDFGEIVSDGQSVTHLPEAERMQLRARIPYLVQSPALLEWLTVEENIALALPYMNSEQRQQVASEAIVRFNLENWRHAHPSALGMGHQKVVSMARAWVRSPKAMLLDEPTTGLDFESAQQVYEALDSLRQQGLGALVVSHDYAGLQQFADNVLVVANGQAAFHGTLEEFYKSPHPDVVALRNAA